MITQKIFKTGNSVAVTIPKHYLEDLGLKEGAEVVVVHDEQEQSIQIYPKKKARVQSTVTPEFLKWLEDFNKEYGPALKELAKR